jgi:uncharacterized protein (TIGR02466 family)
MTSETKIEIMDTQHYFSTPVYQINKPEWLEKTIKLTDKHIDNSYKKQLPKLKEREKLIGKKDFKRVKDHGFSYHSESLVNEKGLELLQSYIANTAWNLLNEWGYKMDYYSLTFTEFWVQEFSKNGGGHHAAHVHWDNHISGFYFLKCSDKTSYPILHDPRAGAMMTKLHKKDEESITTMSDSIYLKPVPGDLIFFPSFIPHEFAVDNGLEPFRFIHFNLQAVRNYATRINKI